MVGRWSPLEGVWLQPRYVLAAGIVVGAWISEPVRLPRRHERTAQRAIYAITIWLIGSAIWSPAGAFALSKAIEVATIGAVCASAARCTRAFPFVYSRAFWSTTVALALLLGILAFAAQHSDGLRLAVLGGGPNTFGRTQALGAVIAIQRGLTEDRRFVNSAATVLLTATTVLSGSRGAMLGLGVGAAAILIAAPRTRAISLMAVVAAIAAAAFAASPSFRTQVETTYAVRIQELVIGGVHYSGREAIWSSAYSCATHSPIVGTGLGAFEYRNGFYPHNLVLEIGCEGGMLAVVALGVMSYAVVAAMAGSRIRALAGHAGAWLAIAVATQFSGDLYDSRGVFLLATISLASVVEFRNRQLFDRRRADGGTLPPASQAGMHRA